MGVRRQKTENQNRKGANGRKEEEEKGRKRGSGEKEVEMRVIRKWEDNKRKTRGGKGVIGGQNEGCQGV